MVKPGDLIKLNPDIINWISFKADDYHLVVETLHKEDDGSNWVQVLIGERVYWLPEEETRMGENIHV